MKRSKNSQVLLGIDFSGDAARWSVGCTRSNVWIAKAVLEGEEIKLINTLPVQALSGVGTPFERMSGLFASSEAAYIAIDAPFSVPHQRSVHAVRLWKLVDGLPCGSRPFAIGSEMVRALAPELGLRGKKELRETEAYWQTRGVSVRSTMWAGPRGGAPFAVACMSLLAKHRGPVWPFPLGRCGGSVLVEAFPAAQLQQWGLPYRRYSGDGERALENRLAIITCLQRQRYLRLNERQRLDCVASADVLDAVVCLYAAAAVATDNLVVPRGERSESEGLISVHH